MPTPEFVWLFPWGFFFFYVYYLSCSKNWYTFKGTYLKCTIWWVLTHKYTSTNHQHNQDNEYIHYPSVIPHVPLLSSLLHISDSAWFPSKHWSTCFLSPLISLHFLEFYINQIMYYILFFGIVSIIWQNYLKVHPCCAQQ